MTSKASRLCLLHVLFSAMVICFAGKNASAQGPPITTDGPLMLGGGSFTIRTLTEIRKMDIGTFIYIPLMAQYLPTSNTQIGITMPYMLYNPSDGLSGNGFADIQLTGKYQFYRKDGTGKTFRMVAKTVQSLPSGKALDLMDLSTGKYQGYAGVIAGYESLKFGISNELGYSWMPDGTMDGLRHKLGFGLPLLKPVYPNKQLNLYFEYSNFWLPQRDGYQLLYSQGFQYASKDITFDLAIQTPLVNDMPIGMRMQYSMYFGSRYTF